MRRKRQSTQGESTIGSGCDNVISFAAYVARGYRKMEKYTIQNNRQSSIVQLSDYAR